MNKTTLLTITALSVMVLTNAQTVITVDNSPSSQAQFNNLQSAISQAQSGDILYIHPSETNYGIADINKSLTLIGFSHSSSEKETLIEDILLRNNASNTSIKGIHITDRISTDDNTTTINNIVIENCLIDNFIRFEDAGMDGVIIRGNIINELGNSTTSTTQNNYANTLITNNIIGNQITTRSFQSITIKNNIFLSPNTAAPVENLNDDLGNLEVQNSIFLFDTTSSPDMNDAGVTFTNCLTFNLSSGTIIELMGSNNLDNLDPLFIEDNDNTNFEALIDNYNLQASSPALNAGVNGEDLGIFDGSNFVFDNFGFTNGIPTINIQAISTSVAPGQNLNVIINTANQ